MRVSPNRAWLRQQRLALAASLALALVPAAAAAQQVGPPIPLIPPSTDGSAQTAPLPAPVASQPLAPPEPGWDGDIKPQGAALPGNFWHGTTRARAETLLASLPETTSPALQDLARHLLLSSATAPAGPDAGDRRLPALRAAALLRLGELDAVRTVVAAAPQDQRAAMLPYAVDADAIAGNVDHACDTVTATIRQDQRFGWQRDLIACQALHGDVGQAALGLQLLAEQKDRDDDALSGAIDALAQHPAPATIDRLDHPEPLLLRLLVAAHRNFTPALIAKLHGDAALTLALDDKTPVETRLAAGERAAALGALPLDRLRSLYAAAGGDTPGNGADKAAVGRAHRLAALSATADPADRLARIVAFVDAYPATAGGLMLAARLVAPAAHDITPSLALAASATTVARLLIAAGDLQSAQPWVALAPAAERAYLAGLLTIAETPDGAVPGDIPGTPSPEMTVKLLAVRLALGSSPSAADWERLPAASWVTPGPPSPPPAAAFALDDASRRQRVGETILAAILVAAPRGVLSADPVALYDVIRGLMQVRRTADARRLAVEAALAR